MNTDIVLSIPKCVLQDMRIDEAAFGQELKVLAAVKLYELGRLTSGKAAKLAGLPKVEFMLALQRYQVFPLEAELGDLEQEFVTSDWR